MYCLISFLILLFFHCIAAFLLSVLKSRETCKCRLLLHLKFILLQSNPGLFLSVSQIEIRPWRKFPDDLIPGKSLMDLFGAVEF